MSLLRPTILFNTAAKAASFRYAPLMATRFYAVSASDAQTRVLDVVKGFEKVDPSKVKQKKQIPLECMNFFIFNNYLGYC